MSELTINEAALARSLLDVPGLVPDAVRTADMEIEPFTGGHANLTYRVRFADYSLVVRRPPQGDVPPGAHDMQREHRVLAALSDVYPPAPKGLHYCLDSTVIGAPFLVAEYREGCVIRDEVPPPMQLHPNVAFRVSMALVDAMAQLHQVDYQKTGLGNLGKPRGFIARQLVGWKKRWDTVSDTPSRLFDSAWRQLTATIPHSTQVAIVHNDFKLDNCQFAADNPDAVTAVFDWDMATLGDPLIDLGNLLGYWQEAGETVVRLPTRTMTLDGFATRAEITERYNSQSNLDLSCIHWYEAFALWRNAAVFRQLSARYARGETADTHYRDLNDSVMPLVELAAERVSQST